MNKNQLLAVTTVTISLLLNSCVTFAQTDESKIKVSGHYTILNAPVSSGGENKQLVHGYGGRLSFSIGNSVDLEGELNYFPENISTPFGDARTRRVKPNIQGLFGVKIGKRNERIGIFGKLRPGIVRYSPLDDCQSEDFNDCRSFSEEQQRFLLRTVRKTEFAFDVGAVIEGYLSNSSFVRIDIGDTYLRYGDTRFFVPFEPGSSIPRPGIFVIRPGFKRHNLQISIGGGIRF